MFEALLSLLSRVTQGVFGARAPQAAEGERAGEGGGAGARLEALGEVIVSEVSAQPPPPPPPPSPPLRGAEGAGVSPLPPTTASPASAGAQEGVGERSTPSAAALFAEEERRPRGGVIRIGRSTVMPQPQAPVDPREGPQAARGVHIPRVIIQKNPGKEPAPAQALAPVDPMSLAATAPRLEPQGRLVRPSAEPAPPPALPPSGRVMGVGRGRERTRAPAEETPTPAQPPGSAAPPRDRAISMEQLRYQATNAPNPTNKNAIGLNQMSATQASLSKEQRVAPPSARDLPSRVESTAYARFWGTYSASDTPLRFTSLLEVEVSLGAPLLTSAPNDPSAPPERPKRRVSDEEVWCSLLGGRAGFFGDALDLQWVRERFEGTTVYSPPAAEAYTVHEAPRPAHEWSPA